MKMQLPCLTKPGAVIALSLLVIESRGGETWLGGTDNQWTTPANWSGNALPISADLVIYNASSASNLSNHLSEPFSIYGIVVSNPAAGVSINGDALILGPGGIDTSQASQPLTINAPVIVNEAQTWTNISAAVNIAGPVSGSATLNVGNGGIGAGRVILSGGNTFSGPFNVYGGTLQVGSGTVNGVLPLNVALVSGNVDFNVAANTSQTYAGTVTGTGGLYKDGSGALYLTGTNSITVGITNNTGPLWLSGSMTWANGAAGISCISNLGSGIHLNGTNGNLVFPSNITWFASQPAGSVFNESGSNQINGPFTVGALVRGAGDGYVVVNSGTLTLGGSLSGNVLGTTLRIGGPGTGTISGPIVGPSIQLWKMDSGTWTIASTSVSESGYNWVLVAGTNAAPGSTLIVNGQLRSTTAPVVVLTNATLAGYGVIGGPVTIQSGGTLALGAGVGTLTLENTLTLEGTNIMKVAKGPGFTANDLITGMSSVSCGGTLIIQMIGDSPLPGDTFKLYEAGSYSGGFSNIILPSLGSALAWDTSLLASSGVLKVIESPDFSAASVLPNGQAQLTIWWYGASGTSYRLWASSNPALTPITNTWTLLNSGTLNGGPNSFTDQDAPNHPARFYVISVP